MTTEPTMTPGMDTPCPWVPDDASDYEAQEIRRHWRNALSHLREAQGRLDYEARLLWATRGERTYQHRVAGGGGLTSWAMLAEAEMVALTHVAEGVYHRRALARQAAEVAEAWGEEEALDCGATVR